MNQSRRLRLSKLALGLVVALAAAPTFAQSTSAGVGGLVTGSDGAPVAGAEVTITHTESGTVSRATTDESGRYNARGLRVGGPYTITVVKSGAGTKTEDNVFLNLNQVSTVNAALTGDVTTLETVQAVYTGGSEVFSADKMGAGTTITRQQLETYGSIKRDLQDYARLDPRVSQTDKTRGEMSVLGQNSRYNSITIDGVSTSDTFGLEGNGLPTEKQPISIDAIDEVQVNVTNYDVAQPRYSGANINAVTKSGTNDFHGSVSYIYRDKDMVGDLDGAPFTAWEDERTYGATFGGPLLKDKLFFFVSYEKFERTGPGASNGPAGSGTAFDASGISADEVQQVIDIAQSRYGVDAGGLVPPGDSKNETEDKLVKLDWNINDNHRLSLRFNETEQAVAIFPNATSTNRISLSSQAYSQVKTFETQVAQLYSDWSDNFSTEFKVSHRDYDSVPTLNTVMPTVVVNVSEGTGGAGYVLFGTDQFRHSNVLQTETWNYYGVGNWFLGDHTVKFGFDYESNDVYNLFVESSLGVFGFNSIADFADGNYSAVTNSPISQTNGYTLRAPSPGANPAADFTLDNIGLFVQDTWAITPNLTLMFGVRADIPKIDDVPRYNALADSVFGYRNDVTIDGNELIQPRFGFNYTFDSERQTQVRGGVGLFQAAAANVWLGNPFTNNGQTITVYQSASGVVDDLTNVALPPGTTPTQDLDILEPGLKQPSVWKANLALDHELPWWGLVGSVELVLTNVEDGFAYQHLNLGDATGYAPDGRQIFWQNPTTGTGSNRFNRDRRFNDVLLTKNSSKGEGQNLTLSLSKPNNDSDWSWQAAYSYSETTETNPLTSSRAVSNWRNQASFNPNDVISARSNYVVRDRFTAALNWSHAFFGDNKTSVGLFYEGRSGQPYSWIFNNDVNGDGRTNDLLYIPSGPDDVVFRDIVDGLTAGQQAQIFWDAVAANPELAASRGRAMDRNEATMAWRNNFDLRISQELPGFFKGNKALVWVDVLNVGNLINKDWGLSDEVLFNDGSAGFARNFVTYRGIEGDKYVYEVTGQPEGTVNRDLPSRWAVQVGVSYKF